MRINYFGRIQNGERRKCQITSVLEKISRGSTVARVGKEGKINPVLRILSVGS